MLSMVLLKMAADLAFYYTFAGPIARHFGASGAVMLGAIGLGAFCFGLSYLLESRGWLRFLPLLLGSACLFLPGLSLADRVAALPPLLYSWAMGIRALYRPEWGQQAEIFNIFWKIFLAYVSFSFLLQVSREAIQLEVTLGMVMLVCSVLLLRSLRHEPGVYCQKKYQLLNLALVLAALALAGLLSSKAFLSRVLALVGAVYQVIAHIFVRLLLLVLQGLAYLFRWIRIQGAADREVPEMDLRGAAEIFGVEDSGGGSSPVFRYVLIALAVLAAAYLLVRLFRFLARRYGEDNGSVSVRDTRVYLTPEEAPEEKAAPGSAVQKVRRQYQRFLRLCLKRGRELKRSDTSLQVNQRCGDLFGESAEELRQIYLKARYDHRADKADASRAKELVADMKKSADE